MSKFKTIYLENALDRDMCNEWCNELSESVEWVSGVKGTRLASGFFPEQNELVDLIVEMALSVINKDEEILNADDMRGYYLNNYVNGSMYTPTHYHKNSIQLIISLGETRTLKLGKKEYKLKSGDIIIFGSSSHGIIKSDTDKQRISIACFLKRNI